MEQKLREKIENYFNQTEYKKAKEIIDNSKNLFVEYLKSVDHQVDKEFTTAIGMTIDNYISIDVLSREIGTSKSSIKRWIGSINHPHQSVRPFVLEMIVRLLKE
jgi:capsid portal protein